MMKRKRTPRGTLLLIACLLITSAAIRTVGDVSQALASGTDKEGQVDTQITNATCQTEDDLHAMLKSFQRREDRLALQEKAMLEKQEALALADRQIETKLKQLETAEQSLRKTMTMADTAAESDVSQLTKVYETMKPKQAANLFEEMSPDFAAGFLGRMRPDAVAGIMANLKPEVAHTISVILAGRNAGAPRK